MERGAVKLFDWMKSVGGSFSGGKERGRCSTLFLQAFAVHGHPLALLGEGEEVVDDGDEKVNEPSDGAAKGCQPIGE